MAGQGRLVHMLLTLEIRGIFNQILHTNTTFSRHRYAKRRLGFASIFSISSKTYAYVVQRKLISCPVAIIGYFVV